MDIIGGYRLVRRLGVGERAEVFLGHADVSEGSRGVTAAIKVFKPAIEQNSIDREVAVLARTDSRHLLSLRDVATASDSRQCLVLPRLGHTLTRLLAERPTLALGEVVTILAPIADSIAELHDARCCHGGLRPSSVFFDAAGAPVVACFGRASLFAVPRTGTETRGASVAELSAEPGVVSDLHDLRTLAGTLLVRALPAARSGRHNALLDWMDAIELNSEVGTFARELSARLFELGQAIPVQFSPVPDATPTVMRHARRVSSGSAVDVSTNVAGSAHSSEAVVMASLPSLPVRLLMAMRRLPVLARVYPRVQPVIQRIGAVLTTVRTPFRIAGGVGLFAIILALVLIPANSGSTEGARPQPNGSDVQQQPASGVPRTKASAVPTNPSTGDGENKTADDPVLAIKVLLREREACFGTLSAVCLDSVDQKGSSAWDDDSYLMRSLQEGDAKSTPSIAGLAFTLTQRLGDSALLTTEVMSGKNAQSILIVKGESGWRIRDVIAE